MTSVDCTSVEGIPEGATAKHARFIKSVIGFQPLSWDVLDWQTRAELFHSIGTKHVIDYGCCVWVAQGVLNVSCF